MRTLIFNETLDIQRYILKTNATHITGNKAADIFLWIVMAIIAILIVIMIVKIKRIRDLAESKYVVKPKNKNRSDNVGDDDSYEYDDSADVTDGRLLIRYFYNTRLTYLNLKIISAFNLPTDVNDGTVDTFIRIISEPKALSLKVLTTDIVKDSVNPVYENEFKIKISPTDLTKLTLQFLIYDYDFVNFKNKLIGKSIINFCDSDNPNIINDRNLVIHSVSQSKDDFGDLCLVLKYMNNKDFIQFTFVEAKSLNIPRNPFTKKFPPVYIKLRLYIMDKKRLEKTTKIVENMENPYFSEQIDVKIKQNEIYDANFIISVHTKNLIGISSCIGKILLNNTIHHWQQMMNDPRKSIAFWHVLRPPQLKMKFN